MTTLTAQLKIWFWSFYGRYVWDDAKTNHAQIQHVHTILRHHSAGANANVLDVGCGTGEYAVALAQQEFHVTGIDAAAGMLTRARAKALPAYVSRLHFDQIDLDHPLPFATDTFHHAIAMSVLQAVSNPKYTLVEIRRVLKPSGLFVLSHTPKPTYHALPLHQEICQKANHLTRKNIWHLPFIAAKSWAERNGGGRYWTSQELQTMLEAHNYRVKSIEPGPPILVVAQKSN